MSRQNNYVSKCLLIGYSTFSSIMAEASLLPPSVSGIFVFVCLFVLGFYGPVNNKVMSSRSVYRGIVPGQA